MYDRYTETEIEEYKKTIEKDAKSWFEDFYKSCKDDFKRRGFLPQEFTIIGYLEDFDTYCIKRYEEKQEEQTKDILDFIHYDGIYLSEIAQTIVVEEANRRNYTIF